MTKIELIGRYDRDNIGKYYLKKAADFTAIGEIGKAYEFLLEGLDYLTCDCDKGGWRAEAVDLSNTVLNDLKYTGTNYSEYYFVKAFFLSYIDSKKELYLALDAIDHYLYHDRNEYGLYVKGKVLLGLNEYTLALQAFTDASKYNSCNSRLNYRIGRTKEQFLNEYGLDKLFEAYLLNPTSTCCGRELRNYSKSRNINIKVPENIDNNTLLASFTNNEPGWTFQEKLRKAISNHSISGNSISILSNLCVSHQIVELVQVLSDNAEAFKLKNASDDELVIMPTIEYTEFDIYDSNESEYSYEPSYSRYGGAYGYDDDAIDSAFDGDPENYWNVD